MADENNIIGHLVDHPDISYQMIITQKTDGKLAIALCDHISKTSIQKTEEEWGSHSEFIILCKSLVEKIKTAHRNVVLFDKKN